MTDIDKYSYYLQLSLLEVSVTMVILDWLMVTIFMRVELKSVSIMTGILFVMMDGAVRMLELFVINLDILTVPVSRACTIILLNNIYNDRRNC